MDPTQDRDSPEAVIRRYSDMVYRLAFARTGNRSDAEDLYQEVFLRYLTRAPAFTSEEHRKAWLLRVAVNCANRFHTARGESAPSPSARPCPSPRRRGRTCGRSCGGCRSGTAPFCTSTTTRT